MELEFPHHAGTGAVLDIGPPTDSLFDPDQVRTYSLRVRNTGNDVDGIELRILELDVNGNTIPHERTDRFETASDGAPLSSTQVVRRICHPTARGTFN